MNNNSLILSEEIIWYFRDSVQGVYSDMAWYELNQMTASFLRGNMSKKEFLGYIEMVFDIDEDTFKELYKSYKIRANDLIEAEVGVERVK